jgi:ribosomal-protein-alanine N-acetyltransferase
MLTKKIDNELVIELARFDDLGSIMDIEHTSFSEPWTEKMFEAERTGNQFSYIYVARPSSGEWETGSLIGYICFWCIFEELRILNLAVHPKVRRLHIANQLVQFSMSFGRSQGTVKALLEVRSSNTPAVSLYQSLGFLEYGRRKDYYSNPMEDAILMERASLP